MVWRAGQGSVKPFAVAKAAAYAGHLPLPARTKARTVLDIPLIDLLLLALALIAAGAATGVLAGLFGVGGGAVMVPVLYELFGVLGVAEEVRMPLCVGTSLAIIVPTSLRSIRAHRAKGAVDEAVLKAWRVPLVIGVIVGSAIAGFAPPEVFQAVFVVVALANAAKLLLPTGHLRIAEDLPQGPLMRVYGLVIGLLSSLMGIGGGTISNLIMSFHGRSVHQAVATSAGVGMFIAIPGAIGYMLAGWPQMDTLPPFSIGFVSVVGFALVVPTSYLTAPLGARLAHALSKRKLELAFGIFLLLTASRFVVALIA